MRSWDDRRLIGESLKGRQDAYGELVQRYQNRLFNTVLRLLDNAEDAQDVTQEAFFSAYQSLGNFKGDSLFFTWLYRIAVNAAISMKRRKKVWVSLDLSSEHDLAMEPVDQSIECQPGEALLRQEEEEVLQSALNRMSLEHRSVIVLKDIEDMRYEDIAEILQVPVGTVRSRLHRARLELRAILAPLAKSQDS